MNPRAKKLCVSILVAITGLIIVSGLGFATHSSLAAVPVGTQANGGSGDRPNGAPVLSGGAGLAQAQASAGQGSGLGASAIYRGVSTAVKFDISPPLRSIKALPPGPGKIRENEDRENTGKPSKIAPSIDTAVQKFIGAFVIPTPIISFSGPLNTCACSPPDPNGEVGPNHYLVMTNLSFQIYSKTGISVYGPALNNTLWSGFGGPCQTENAGDPVVLYDQLANRWFLSQFTAAGPTYFNCIALSTSPDPTGTYYRWAFTTGANFPDYPKYGIWPDGYYISTREFAGGSTFAGVGAYVGNRTQMLAGNPSPQIISFLAPPNPMYNVGDGLLPTDMDGTTPPPAGSPNYYVGSMDNNAGYGAPQDALTLWKFHADFNNPPSSSFVLANTLPTDPFNSVFGLCGGGRNCIPQPGTTNRLDILSYRQRPLFRLAYRNMGGFESLLTNQSVSAGTGPGGETAGIRWYELRSPNSNPVIFQQGTYAPGLTDGIHRWMGSMAMDQSGDIALGYSVSSSTVFPGIRYTGRLPGDPPGQMPQGEGTFIDGTGSQTSSMRWGDYTDMTVDPTDDCTFWYIDEYVPTTSANGWRTRIGAFKFPSCGTGGGTPTRTNTPGGATNTPTRTNTPPPPTNTPTRTPTPGGCNPTWTAGPTITPARHLFQGASANGAFYIFGGQTSASTATAVPNVERYDPGSNTWQQRAPLPVAVGQDSVGVVDGNIYVAGGFIGGSTVTSTLQIYNVGGNIWSFGPSMPQLEEAGAGVALNNKFYVIGGDDFTNALTNVQMFDPSTNQWSARAPLPAGRTNTSATALGSFIYVFGGALQSGPNFVADDHLLRYDPTANTWTDLGSAGTGGNGNYGTITPFGSNKLLVTDGGNSNFQPVATTHIYDIGSSTWTSGPTMATARLGQASGQLFDGRIIEAGGLGAGTPQPVLASTEILPPCGGPTNTPTRTNTPGGATSTPTRTPTPGCGTPSAWVTASPVPTARGRGAGATIGNNIYVFGGRPDNTTYTQSVYRYDTAAGTWTLLSSTLPDAMTSNMAAGVLTFPEGQRVFIAGGSGTGSAVTSRTLAFNPASGAFIAKDPWPASPARIPGGWAVYNNKLYVFGGFAPLPSPGIMYADIWQYDPTTNTWTQLSTQLGMARGYIATELMPDGLIYLAGGSQIDSAGSLTDEMVFEKFNPSTGAIVSGPAMPEAKSNNQGYNVGGEFYVPSGGYLAPNHDTNVLIYNSTSNSWRMGATTVNAARNYAKGYGANGAIYAIGGLDPAASTFYDYNQRLIPAGSCGTPTSTPVRTNTFTPVRTITVTPVRTSTPQRTITPCGECNMDALAVVQSCYLDGTVHWIAIIHNPDACGVTAPWRAELQVRTNGGTFRTVRIQYATSYFGSGDTIWDGFFCYHFSSNVRDVRVEWLFEDQARMSQGSNARIQEKAAPANAYSNTPSGVEVGGKAGSKPNNPEQCTADMTSVPMAPCEQSSGGCSIPPTPPPTALPVK